MERHDCRDLIWIGLVFLVWVKYLYTAQNIFMFEYLQTCYFSKTTKIDSLVFWIRLLVDLHCNILLYFISIALKYCFKNCIFVLSPRFKKIYCSVGPFAESTNSFVFFLKRIWSLHLESNYKLQFLSLIVIIYINQREKTFKISG